MYYKKIVGEKVYLSPMDIENESSKLVKWVNEDETIAYGSGFYRSLLGEQKTKEMLEKWDEAPFAFSIVSLETDEYLGNISLFNLANDYATMGVFIGKEFQGNGFGKEAIELLCNYAFLTLNMKSIHLEVFAYNSHAYELYKKLGFKECGRWHEVRFHQGKYHDVILMEKMNPNH